MNDVLKYLKLLFELYTNLTPEQKATVSKYAIAIYAFLKSQMSKEEFDAAEKEALQAVMEMDPRDVR